MYDYFLKDHLGNTRAVLTDEYQQDVYPAATVENTNTAALNIEKSYYNILDANIIDETLVSGFTSATYSNYYNNNGNPPYNNNPSANTLAANTKLYKLTGSGGTLTGLGTTLRVMAGDKVDIFAKSYWYSNGTQPANGNLISGAINNFINALTGTPAVAGSGKGATAAALEATGSPTVSTAQTWLSGVPGAPANTPKAYVNWILFDEQFKVVAASSGFDLVNTAAYPNQVKPHQRSVNITQTGYLYVYCSNESNIPVYFDNLQVIQTRGPLLETDNYYPFGLTMSGISSQAAGKLENLHKYNKGSELQHKEFSDGSGLEIYDTHFRQLDPQIGRWNQIDPKCENSINPNAAENENAQDESEVGGLESMSPYTSMGNDPILHNDPNGDLFGIDNLIGAIVGAAVDYGEQVAANYISGVKNPWINNISLTSIGTSSLAGAITDGGTAVKALVKVTAAVINNTVDVRTSTNGITVKVDKSVLNVAKNTVLDLAADATAKGLASKGGKILAKVGLTSNNLAKGTKSLLKQAGVDITRNINQTVKKSAEKVVEKTKDVLESTIKATTSEKRDELKDAIKPINR